MQPCSLQRKLKLFPGVASRSKLRAKLTPTSKHWQELPPQFKQVVQPTLWKASRHVTLMVIATACLTTLFLSLRYAPMRVGYWMVKATVAEKEQLRVGQQVKGYHANTDCNNWWHAVMEQSYLALSDTQREALAHKAALAIFLNPPVSPVRRARHCKHACMCLRVGKASGKHIQWVGGYPHLVLQQAGVTKGGESYPSISVPAHQLVAWLFLGPKPGGQPQVVCHNDVAPEQLLVKWEATEQKTVANKLCFPLPTRCLSKGCVCPVCLQFGTQSQNARTGKQRLQLAERNARQK